MDKWRAVVRNAMRGLSDSPTNYLIFKNESATCWYFEYRMFIDVTIRHQLGLSRPVSASFNSLFKGFRSHLLPFGPQFSIIFGTLLLFILVTCRSKFDLHLLSFSSTGSTFNSSKNFFVLFVVRKGVSGCTCEIFNLVWCQSFLYFLLMDQISSPYERM